MPKIKLDVECPECSGTGLYKGFAEQDGCAVVCSSCKGTGKYKFQYEYKEFKKRNIRKDVKRVFDGSHVYGCSAKDYTDKETGKTIHFSKYGCTYEEWLKGIKPKPVEELYCPYIYVGCSYGNEPLKKCRKNVGNFVSKCKEYYNKEQCWKEYWKIKGGSKDEK